MATTSFTGWLSAPFTYLTTGDVVLSGSVGGRGGGLGLHGSVAIPGGVPGVIAAYGSIVAIPAALTVLVETVAKKRRRQKPALQPAQTWHGHRWLRRAERPSPACIGYER